MFSRSKMDSHTPPPRLPSYNPPWRPHMDLTSQELTEEISTSLTSTNGGSSLSSSGTSNIDTQPRVVPNQVASQLMRLTDSKPRGTTTRKRDILLPAIGRPSIEKPLSVSTPLPPWAAPPFFKALSGAVRHSQLATCALSASAIIYISSHAKNGQQVKDIGFGYDHEKTERVLARHRRHVSESIAKAKWSQKIFILTPSGYVLQFASEGPFNRLPEKSIKLGKGSVAFASDLIPGRHWVLQLSNVTDPLAPSLAVNSDAQKPRSRLSFKPTENNKPAMNFLLILDSGEELNSWLTAVRHEIAMLGGKKSETETASTKIDNKYNNTSVHLRSESESLTHGQTHSPALAPQESVNETQSNRDLEYDRESSRFEERRQSEPRPSVDAMSQAASSISHEGRLLDSLRNSTLYSYPRISIGARTFFTSPSPSRDTSPSQSPMKETFFGDDEDETVPVIEVTQQRPNATAISERRRSFMAHQPSILEAVLPERSRPNSMVGPSIQTSSPSASGFAFNDGVVRQRSARKNPPTALMTRLSVVEDQPSPALFDHISTVQVESAPSPRYAFNILDGKLQRKRNPDFLITSRPRRRPSLASPINPQGLLGPDNATRGLSHEDGLTPIPSPTASEDDFQFRYWNSRLQNVAAPAITDASVAHSRHSLCRSDAFDLEHALGSVDSPPPPPLPMSSYPFTKEGSHVLPKPEPQPQVGAQQQQAPEPTEEMDAAMFPLPLSPDIPPQDLATPIGRANARALSNRAERVAGAQMREKRDSVSKPQRRPQRPQSFRPTPPMPLSARDFLNRDSSAAPPPAPTRPRPTRSTSDAATSAPRSHLAAQQRMSSLAPATAVAPLPSAARNTAGSLRRASILVSPAQTNETVHPAAATSPPGKRNRSSRLSARRSVQVTDAGPPLAPPPTCGLPAVPGLSLPAAPPGRTWGVGGYVDELRRRRK